MARRARTRKVTASDAAKNFGALADRVRSERAAYVVERGGVPVVRIEPVDVVRCTFRDLADWLADREPLDSRYLAEVERLIRAANTPAVPGDPWER
jgi:hypothetical protein